MVAMSTSLAYRSFELDSIATVRAEKLTSMGQSAKLLQRTKLQWAGSRETNRASGRGRTFFLTSLFIELIWRSFAVTNSESAPLLP